MNNQTQTTPKKVTFIKCPSIEKPLKKFLCKVLRAESELEYQDSQDGLWKPIHPENWEYWGILAETQEGAKKIAEYHFYLSNAKNIIISNYEN